MKQLMADIVAQVKRHGQLNPAQLNRILATHNRRFAEAKRHFTKKQLAPYFLGVKAADSQLWDEWSLSEDEERALLASIQMKPRRTASGVATITVITKPHPCAGNCVYCPNDVRMPKSYLHSEPACQRAERCFFDPYLQVASRLAALELMGHATEKIELIVLGGTFTDYPASYQTWFAHEMFRALNDAEDGMLGVADVFAQRQSSMAAQANSGGCLLASETALRLRRYAKAGLPNDESLLSGCSATWQNAINRGEASYNQAVEALYGPGSAWAELAQEQHASPEQLETQQARNESARHRVVGFVVETRPNAASARNLRLLRQLGCTKLQMGVQTLDEEVARRCNRPSPVCAIQGAFELARAFGFKSHAHFMANLPGATPQTDAADYASFVHDRAIAPDEVKLYPCVLLPGTALDALYKSGLWEPYEEDELVSLLAKDLLETPAHTRISRMIRDFSSNDIVAGNKKTNLRQLVEERVSMLAGQGAGPISEIRTREVATDAVDAHKLHMEDIRYATSNSTEHFLQWVSEEDLSSPLPNRIAGFLRLSLPDPQWISEHEDNLPVEPGDAMIREVHVYGAAARLHASTSGAQHQGLGRALVQKACKIARESAYARINVISAVGTRNYYRALGFRDAGLYLQKSL